MSTECALWCAQSIRQAELSIVSWVLGEKIVESIVRKALGVHVLRLKEKERWEMSSLLCLAFHLEAYTDLYLTPGWRSKSCRKYWPRCERCWKTPWIFIGSNELFYLWFDSESEIDNNLQRLKFSLTPLRSRLDKVTCSSSTYILETNTNNISG